MPICVEADTLDDLMRRAIEQLLETGQRAADTPSRGPNIESLGARLQLTNPRARLSRTEARRRVVSAIGELAWYLRRVERSAGRTVADASHGSSIQRQFGSSCSTAMSEPDM